MGAIRKPSLAAAALVAGWLALLGAAQSQTELIVASFGGAYDAAVLEGAKSFVAEHSVKITMVPGAGHDALVRVRNREVDVIVSDPLFTLPLEAENAFEKLDLALVPNLADIHPMAKYSDYTVAANLGAYVMAYSPERVKEKPTSWFDLAKPEFADRVVLRSFRAESVDLIVLFSKLAGGDERHPDAGFQQMAEIAENVHAWTQQHAETLQLFRNGEVDIGTWTDGRVRWAKEEEGVNVEATIPKEGFFAFASTVNVVKDRPNIELSQKFVNHMLGAVSGEIMAARLGYFPTNTTIELPENVASKMTINKSNIDDLHSTDWKYIVTVFNEWARRWDREVVR